jgi:hypothetical protein
LTAQTCTASSCSVTAPANGTLGNCPSVLSSGNSCQFTCNSGFILSGATTSCTAGSLTAQTCAPPPSSTTAPIPLWPLGALAAVLVGIAMRRMKRVR